MNTLLYALLTITVALHVGPASAACPANFFDCGNGQCVPQKFRCDGDRDCENNLDKEGCSANWCPEHKSMCDGRCLPQQWRCDGDEQCSDGTDEEDCGACQDGTCSQGCKVVDSRPSCYCYKGYRTLDDGISCGDVDECAAGTHQCEQTCVNTPGSYYCLCASGYNLLQRKHCRAGWPEPVLLYTSPSRVGGVWLRSNKSFAVSSVETKGIAIDFDADSERVLWSGGTGGRMFSSFLNGSSFRTIIPVRFSVIDGVAFDWITRNIYITDVLLKHIRVCTTDGRTCIPIVTEAVQKPRAIVLRPEMATMYWTDWGDNAAIWRADMDGTRASYLVADAVAWPNGLAYDRPTDRLYWCDAKLNTIEYLELDTMKRAVLLQRDDVHPFGLAVFESTVYWSDWSSSSIEMFNKYDGSHRGRLLQNAPDKVMGITVYHPVLRPKNISNPCQRNACETLCVLSGSGYKCLCSTGGFCPPKAGHGASVSPHRTQRPAGSGRQRPVQLAPNQNDSKSVYVAGRDALYRIQHQASFHGAPTLTKIPLDTAIVVGALAYDAVSGYLYISDISGRKIFRFNGTARDATEIRTYESGTVPGMDFDAKNKNLYWVNPGMRTLEICKWNGTGHVVLLEKLKAPYDVAVYPKRGLMFVLSVGDFTAITRYTMDGKNPKKLKSLSAFRPLSLSVDLWSERLFWADAFRNGLGSVSLNDSSYSPVTIVEDVRSIVETAAAVDNLVHWVSEEESRLYFMHMSEGVIRNVHINDTSLRAVVQASSPPDDGRGVCFAPNSQVCQYNCVPVGETSACLCPPAMVLAEDGKTCRKMTS